MINHVISLIYELPISGRSMTILYRVVDFVITGWPMLVIAISAMIVLLMFIRWGMF